MNLYDLTWPEVEAYLKNKKSIIIPAGTCKQHGMHLPLNTDTIVTEYIAGFLSEETGIVVALYSDRQEACFMIKKSMFP